jgi:hypothetical protein
MCGKNVNSNEARSARRVEKILIFFCTENFENFGRGVRKKEECMKVKIKEMRKCAQVKIFK